MNIFMTGGTGFVGTTLARELSAANHRVTILTRPGKEKKTSLAGVSYVDGDPTRRGPWQEKVPGHDVLINLAGSPVFARWTDAVKKDLRESRILTTAHLVEALESGPGERPSLLSTSAVGYYGFHGDEELDETSGPGSDFLAALALEWEEKALEAEKRGVRVVICRFGIVMGKNGGALAQMVRPFRFGAGSPLGSGRQWFSWIHEMDLVRIFLFLMENQEITGPVNCTAPHPVRNGELTKIMGRVLGVPTFLPAVPGFLVSLILGEFGSVLLKGQKVMPVKLLKAGFRFEYPDMERALKNLLK